MSFRTKNEEESHLRGDTQIYLERSRKTHITFSRHDKAQSISNMITIYLLKFTSSSRYFKFIYKINTSNG